MKSIIKSIVCLSSVILFCLTNESSAMAQNSPIQSFTDEQGRWPISIDISNDGKYIATGTYNATLVWELSSGKNISQYDKDIGDIECVNFSKDGIFLLSSGYQFTTILWKALTEELIFKLRSPSQGVHGSVWPNYWGIFSLDEKRIFTLDGYYIFQVWDAQSGLAIDEYQNHFSDLYKILLTNNPDELLLGFGEETVLYNYIAKQKVKAYSGRYRSISGDRKVLLTQSEDRLNFIDMQTGQYIRFLYGNIVDTQAVDLSYTGDIMVVGGNPTNRKVYYTTSPEAVRVYPYDKTSVNTPDSPDAMVKFFPDGKRFLTVNGDTVYIWDISGLASRVKESENLRP